MVLECEEQQTGRKMRGKQDRDRVRKEEGKARLEEVTYEEVKERPSKNYKPLNKEKKAR